MIKLITICGPTAGGKSGLALALSRHLQTVIISADSRQVYREFDIGTAKPTATEQQTVPHYLIDICDPTETLTLADYQEQVQTLLSIPPVSEVSPILLVGGTGLYIKAIVRGLKIPRVPAHPDLRSQLANLGQTYCYQILKQVDPQATQLIHPNDIVRTLRALEVFYVTGIPISQQQGENPPNYPILQIGLDSENLSKRIEERTHGMIAAGLVEEVAALSEKYGIDLPLLNTLGYREIKDYLAGNITLEEAQGLIVTHTRQFAKRQRTWFRADSTIEWFDSDQKDIIDQVWKRIQQFLQRT